MKQPLKNYRLVRFLSRGDPIAFCVRAIALLIIFPALSLTSVFKNYVEAPHVTLDAWLTWACVRLLGYEATRTGPFIQYSGRDAVKTSNFAVEVIAGCTGQFTMMILAAMILAFPSRWKTKLLGMVAGIALIFVLNLFRLVTLFLIGNHYPQLFEEAHLFVWQTITICVALIFWYAWARHALRGLEAPGAEAANPG